LLEDKTVRCESANSSIDGKRVWFLLKGEEFNVKTKRDDQIYPYICVSNGHDGGAAFRVTPTTIRIWCSNTLNMVVGAKGKGDIGNSAIMFRHTTNIKERVEQARNALLLYGTALAETQELANHLAAKNVKSEDVEKFFLACYTNEYGPIPIDPKDKKEERQRNKAMSAFDSFSMRFDDEQVMFGATAWTAFNAFSGMVQHDAKTRGKGDAARVSRRIESNLFGLNQQRTLNVLRQALSSLAS
jgi:hypothetical protein